MQHLGKRDISNTTIIDGNYFHGYTGGSCGYCHNPSKSISTGFQAKQVKPEDYEKMLCRGFRRCGNYYYKPNLFKSCCKLYTIKIDAINYTMRKSHRKALNKWNRFLAGEIDLDREQENQPQDKNSVSNHEEGAEESLEQERARLEAFIRSEGVQLIKEQIFCCAAAKNEKLSEGELQTEGLEGELVRRDKLNKHCYFSNLIQRIFGINKKRLKFSIREFTRCRGEEILGVLRAAEPGYQILIDKKGNLRMNSKAFLKENPKDGVKNIESKFKRKNFRIETKKAEATQENFELYKRYCEMVHEKKEKSKMSFERFLCTKNLLFQNLKNSDKNAELELGCYHMNYYLDEELVAVGVVDFLPGGFSTVYFYYEPKLRKLKFGVVSSILELEYIKKKSEDFPDFKNYYMGFYIQNCDKMSYKADFEPGLLLCPRSFCFEPFSEEMRKKIEEGKVELSDEGKKMSEDCFEDEKELENFLKENLQLFVNEMVLPVGMFGDQLLTALMGDLKVVFQGWGKTVIKSIVLKLN